MRFSKAFALVPGILLGSLVLLPLSGCSQSGPGTSGKTGGSTGNGGTSSSGGATTSGGATSAGGSTGAGLLGKFGVVTDLWHSFVDLVGNAVSKAVHTGQQVDGQRP